MKRNLFFVFLSALCALSLTVAVAQDDDDMGGMAVEKPAKVKVKAEKAQKAPKAQRAEKAQKAEKAPKAEKPVVALQEVSAVGTLTKETKEGKEGKPGRTSYILTADDGSTVKLPAVKPAKEGAAAPVALDSFVGRKVCVKGMGVQTEKGGKTTTTIRTIASVDPVGPADIE